MEVDENIYFTSGELCNYFYGQFFETFEEYQKTMNMDKNGKEISFYMKGESSL